MDRITLSAPYITKNGDRARLCSDVNLHSENHQLWYETSLEYAKYFSQDRLDAFVVNLLLYAMQHKYAIKCEAPMSERLYYQLNEYLIPSISSNIAEYSSIKIEADLIVGGVKTSNTAVGTGLSGGVDSFYAVMKHLHRKEPSFQLTHLIFCNAGTNGDYGGESARKLYYDRMAKLKRIADENNLSLLCVDTNFNEFLNQVQEQTNTFRTLATPLAFQKLFRYYYYGSTYSFNEFKFHFSDPTHYDLLNMECLSTELLHFYSSGGETSRLGKLKVIADYDIVQRNLNVCVRSLENCGECLKCRRTLLDLFVLDKLDKFKEVFHVDNFYKNIDNYIVYLIRYRKTTDMYEIYKALKQKNVIKIKHYVIAWCYDVGHSLRKFIQSIRVRFNDSCIFW